MFKPSAVLIVSGESEHREKLAEGISKCGLHPICCATLADAKALIARRQFSAVFSEDSLPDGDFCALIGETRRHAMKVPVVVVSRHDDWDSYLTAMGAGAFDYVAFPPNPGELERALWTTLNESSRSEIALAQSAA